MLLVSVPFRSYILLSGIVVTANILKILDCLDSKYILDFIWTKRISYVKFKKRYFMAHFDQVQDVMFLLMSFKLRVEYLMYMIWGYGMVVLFL